MIHNEIKIWGSAEYAGADKDFSPVLSTYILKDGPKRRCFNISEEDIPSLPGVKRSRLQYGQTMRDITHLYYITAYRPTVTLSLFWMRQGLCV